MLHKVGSIATGTFLAICTTAMAQSSVIFDVESPVLMPGQSTAVTLRAVKPHDTYAMAVIVTDLVSSFGGEGWSDEQLIRPMDGPGSSPGPTATGFVGIEAWQLNPLFPGGGADPSSPISFWRATFTAPAEVATPYDVTLSTMTSRFDVYVIRDSTVPESRLSGLTEGHATIRVVPAPAGAVVLGLGVLATGRRRR